MEYFSNSNKTELDSNETESYLNTKLNEFIESLLPYVYLTNVDRKHIIREIKEKPLDKVILIQNETFLELYLFEFPVNQQLG